MTENLSDKLPYQLMKESDLANVLVLEGEGHSIPWTRGIFEDCLRVGYYCPLLEVDGNVQLYAVMSAAAGEAHILNVCVSKSCRNRGLGRKVVLHLLEVARQGKVNTIFLEVRPSNEAAINLYESIGFMEVGLRKNYYPTPNGGREDAILMAMELNFSFSD